MTGKFISYLWYRRKYCVTSYSPGNIIQGTEEHIKLESYIASGKVGNMKYAVKVNVYYSNAGSARVYFDIDLPPQEALKVFYNIVTNISDGQKVIAVYTDQDILFTDFDESILNEEEQSNYDYVRNIQKSSRYDAMFTVLPGKYTLTIALGSDDGYGVVRIPLNIDTLDPTKLTISSIALCKRVRKAGEKPEASDYMPLVAHDYEFTPAADTVFHKDDSLMAYFEVYPPTGGDTPATPAHLQYEMRISNEQTNAIVLDSTQNADSWIQSGKTTVPLAVEPVLSKLKLAKGKYRFEIQASDSAGRKTPWQSTEFSIE